MLFLILSMLVCGSHAKVQWKMADKQSPKYGEDLMLWCKVDDCCLPNKTKRWHGGPDKKTLMLNTGNSTDDSKYKTAIETNGFMLVIKNLSPQDINVTYTCSYGFDQDEKLLSEDMVFLEHAVRKSAYDPGGLPRIVVIVVCIILVVAVVILVAVILFKRGKLKNIKWFCNHNRHEDDRAESQHLNSPENANHTADMSHERHISQSLYSQNTSTASSPQENLYPQYNGGSTITDPMLYTDILRSANQSNSDRIQSNSQNCQHELVNEVLMEVQMATSQNNPANCHEDPASRRQDKQFQYSLSNSQNVAYSDKPKTLKREYESYSLRKKSYNNCWTLYNPTVDQMTEAGFFYLGCKTSAQCFCCGSKKAWCEGDDPLDETVHSICPFLQQITTVRSEVPNDDPDETVPLSV